MVGSILLRGTHPLLTRMKLLNEKIKSYACGQLQMFALAITGSHCSRKVLWHVLQALHSSVVFPQCWGNEATCTAPGSGQNGHVTSPSCTPAPPASPVYCSRRKGYACVGWGGGGDFGTCTDIGCYSYLLGISIGDAIVFFSSSSMSPSFHCSRKICHVPRKKVVTGIMRSQSFCLSLGSLWAVE